MARFVFFPEFPKDPWVDLLPPTAAGCLTVTAPPNAGKEWFGPACQCLRDLGAQDALQVTYRETRVRDTPRLELRAAFSSDLNDLCKRLLCETRGAVEVQVTWRNQI
jgi:hypothetical protein